MSAQKLAVIDIESGEIVNAVDLQPGDSARLVKTSAKSLDYFKVPFNAFAKLNTEEFTYLVGELTGGQLAFICSLIPWLSYCNNCLVNRRGDPLSAADIAKKLNMTRRMVDIRIAEMIDLHILFKGKNGHEFQIYMNPWIACKGNSVNRVLMNMFRHYKIRSKGGVTWKKLQKSEEAKSIG